MSSRNSQKFLFGAVCLLLVLSCSLLFWRREGSLRAKPSDLSKHAAISPHRNPRDLSDSANSKASSRQRRAASRPLSVSDSGTTASQSSPTIKGVVLLPDGKPATGAEVVLYDKQYSDQDVRFTADDPPLRLASAITDASGRYNFFQELPISAFLRASAKGCAPESQQVWRDDRWNTPLQRALTVDFRMHPSVQLSGRALFHSGAPAVGVRVAAAPAGMERKYAQLTSTTLDGSFLFENLKAGETAVCADSPGLPEIVQVIRAPSSDLTLQFASGTWGVIEGKVVSLPDNRSVTSATVAAGMEYQVAGAISPPHTAISGPDGEFMLKAPPDRTIALRAYKERLLQTDQKKFSIGPGETTTGIMLCLSPEVRWTGRVLDRMTSVPLDSVSIWTNYRNWENRPSTPDFVTTASGEFSVLFSQNSYPVIRKQGWSVFEENKLGVALELKMKAAAFRHEVRQDIILTPAVALSGTVRNEAGMPVNGAVLTVHTDNNSGGEAVPLMADGSFVTQVEPDGKWRLYARAPGYAPTMTAVGRPASSPVTNVEIVLRTGSTLSGKVVGPDGEPVAQAQVVLSPLEIPQTLGQNTRYWRSSAYELYRQACDTDKAGAFSFSNVMLGKHMVVAEKHGFSPSDELPVEFARRQATHGIILTLNKAGSISGRVVADDGKPAPGVNVRAYNDLATGARVERSESTDLDGKYTFADLPGTTYTVYISTDDYVTETRKAAIGDTNVNFRLAPRESFDAVLQAMDLLKQSPLPQAEITSTWHARRNKPGKVERDSSHPGRFILHNIVANDSFEVTAAGYSTVYVSGFRKPAAGTIAFKTAALEKVCALTGKVIDSAGRPVAGCDVQANQNRTSGEMTRRNSYDPSAITKPDGQFKIEGVGRNSGTVSVYPASPWVPAVMAYDRPTKEIVDVGEIRLTEGAVLKGVLVRGHAEDPVPDEMLRLYVGGETKTARTAGDGSFLFSSIPATEASLMISATNLRMQLRRFSPGEVRNIRLRASAGTLKLRALVNGKPAAVDYALTRTDGDGQWRIRGTTSPDGAVELTNLVPGRWLVNASARNSTGTTRETTVIVPEDGVEELNINLMSESALIVHVRDGGARPVTGASVFVRNVSVPGESTEHSAGRKTQEGGIAEFDIPAGTYTVWTTKEDVGYSCERNVIVSPGGTTNVDTTLQPQTGEIVIQLSSKQDGSPVPAEVAELIDEGDHGHQILVENAPGDRLGVMRFPKIPVGRHEILIRRSGYLSVRFPVHVETGATQYFEFALERAGSLEIRVVDALGAVAGATCTLEPADGNENPSLLRTGKTDSSGIWSVDDVCVGSYKATALTSSGKSAVINPLTISPTERRIVVIMVE